MTAESKDDSSSVALYECIGWEFKIWDKSGVTREKCISECKHYRRLCKIGKDLAIASQLHMELREAWIHCVACTHDEKVLKVIANTTCTLFMETLEKLLVLRDFTFFLNAKLIVLRREFMDFPEAIVEKEEDNDKAIQEKTKETAEKIGVSILELTEMKLLLERYL